MNAVQCDYCGKFAANPQKVKKLGLGLPESWMFVNLWLGGAGRQGELSDEYGEFCSRECVSAHFAKPRP